MSMIRKNNLKKQETIALVFLQHFCDSVKISKNENINGSEECVKKQEAIALLDNFSQQYDETKEASFLYCKQT